MKTELLYYTDCHIRQFSARVLDCVPGADGYRVTLDRTAFFPGGGGQAADTGTLNGVPVTGMEPGEDPVHLCSGPLNPGDTVTGVLDWLPRFTRMQQHTGEHILSGLVFAGYGYHNTGFHMSPERIQVDFDGVIPADRLQDLEDRANEAVWKNLPVRCWTPGPRELEALSYRTKRALPWPVRIVEIPGYDRCACCGVHTAFTGECGPVKLWSAVPFRGGTRLEMACGRAALAHLNAVYEAARAVSRCLSVPVTDIGAGTETLSEQLAKARYRVRELELRELQAQADALRGLGDTVLFRSAMEPELLVALADRTAESCGGTAAVFSGGDGRWRWCLIDRSKDLRPLVKRMQQALSARGGGKPGFQQGQLTANRSEIEAFFRDNGQWTTGS